MKLKKDQNKGKKEEKEEKNGENNNIIVNKKNEYLIENELNQERVSNATTESLIHPE